MPISPNGREIVNLLWTDRAGVIDLITLSPEGSACWLVSALTSESKGMPVGRGEPSGFRFECEAPYPASGRECLDTAEIAGFVGTFTSGDPAADLISDGVINLLGIQEARRALLPQVDAWAFSPDSP